MEKKTKGKKEKTKVSREFSAGGVVFKKKDGQIFWLVTKSTPSKLYPKTLWRLPKGWLDDTNEGMGPGPLASGKEKADEDFIRKAALREVSEEGGIEAKIILKLGTEKYFYTRKDTGDKKMKFVTFYLMEFVLETQKGPDMETEEVAWLSFDKAREKLSYSSEKKLLDKAKDKLNQINQASIIAKA